MESTNSSNKLMLMGLIGFAVGMLMAPDKGTVTREKLKRQANEMADKAKDKKDKAADKIRDLRSRTKSSDDGMDMNKNAETLVP